MVFAYKPRAILTNDCSATSFLSTRPVWSRSDKSKKSIGVKTESLLRLSRYLILLSNVLRAMTLFYIYTTSSKYKYTTLQKLYKYITHYAY